MMETNISVNKDENPILSFQDEPKKVFQDFFPLFILVLMFVIILIGISYFVQPIIEKNKNNEYLEFVRSFEPEASEAALLINEDYPKEVSAVYQNKESLTQIVDLTTQGYGGDIRALVAVDSSGEISGILIVSHNETVGLGSELMGHNYLINYNDLSLEDFKDYEQTGDNYPVDIVAGSTITSDATAKIVYLGLLTQNTRTN